MAGRGQLRDTVRGMTLVTGPRCLCRSFKGQNSKVRVWRKERFTDREGAGRDHRTQLVFHIPLARWARPRVVSVWGTRDAGRWWQV